MRITYEASEVDLTAVDDIPDIPEAFHRLIAYKAAIILKLSMDLPVGDLNSIATRMEVRYMRAMQDQTWSNEGAVAVAGLARQQAQTRMGRANKI